MNRAEVINEIILKDKPEVKDKYTFDWGDILAVYKRLEDYGNGVVKEFIKHLTNTYAKDYEDKKAMATKSFESEHIYDLWFYKGQMEAIRRLIGLLDKDFENFIKERENDE